MAVALWSLTALIVVLIAVGAVVATSDRLARQPRVAVYDLAEAVAFVADRLPEDLTARLRYDDVEAVLRSRLAVLADLGVAGDEGEDPVLDGPDVVLDDDEVLARVLGALDADLGLDDADVAEILEVEAAYARAIGAVGDAAEG